MKTILAFLKQAAKEKQLLTPATTLVKMHLHKTITLDEITEEFYDASSKILALTKQTSECKALVGEMKSLGVASIPTMKNF
jgi:hypothetical protein